MPVLGIFPYGNSGSGGGGIQLPPVTNVETLTSSGKVYVKWTDPEDLVMTGATLASWAGTILVRKAGSAPSNRNDGVIILDSKTKNAYSDNYFCDSGLTDGVTYYYKLFPYSSAGAYTDSDEGAFDATPIPVLLGNVSDIITAEAGNGKLSIKWTDPAPTVVEDEVMLATWASTTVVVKEGGYATSPNDPDAAYTYTSTTHNGHMSVPLIATGLTNGQTYYVSIFPVTTDGSANMAEENCTTGVPNRLTIAAEPSQNESLTYNANPQTPTWNDYDDTQLTLGGVTSGISAGNFDATFTPKDDYMWSDGSTDVRTVPWSIEKASGSIELSATEVIIDASNLTATVTVSHLGTGAMSVTSSDTNIATVSVVGNTLTISHVDQTTGTATITVKVEEDDNYNAPEEGIITVTAQFFPAKKPLNEMTWEEIRQVSDAGEAANYWKVGDQKTITLNGKVGNFTFSNLSINVFIIGFDHNSSKEGTNRIHFQIGKINDKMVALCDSQYGNEQTSSGYFHMNTSRTNAGGWNNSAMRKTLLGNSNTPESPLANSLMSALPSELRAVMKPVTKYSDNTGGGTDTASYVTATIDYLFLLAEYEVFGTRSYANSAEQNYQLQYEFYRAGNSRIAYKHSATGTAVWWWLRSVSSSYNNNFRNVNTDGSYNYRNASWLAGVVPGFTI